jgi:hypothetical protein
MQVREAGVAALWVATQKLLHPPPALMEPRGHVLNFQQRDRGRHFFANPCPPCVRCPMSLLDISFS